MAEAAINPRGFLPRPGDFSRFDRIFQQAPKTGSLSAASMPKGGNFMVRARIFGLSAALALALAMPPGVAVSQQASVKQQLVGTWTLVSIIATDKEGKKSDRRGPNP